MRYLSDTSSSTITVKEVMQITDDDGKFRLFVNLEWDDNNIEDEQKLIALYKSDNLVYGYVNECSEAEDKQHVQHLNSITRSQNQLFPMRISMRLMK